MPKSNRSLLIGAAIVILVITVVTMVAIGIPHLNGDDDASPSPVDTTPTPTPDDTSTTRESHTKTPSITRTATPSESATSTHNADLQRFQSNFRAKLSDTMERKDLTGVPVLAMDYRTTQNETVLWVVYWQCDQLDPIRDQQTNIANNFAETVGESIGDKPAKVRVYGVKHLSQFHDTSFYIVTTEAKKAYDEKISVKNYTETWHQRVREVNDMENITAYEMSLNQSGQEITREAFNNEHSETGGCHAGANAVNDEPSP